MTAGSSPEPATALQAPLPAQAAVVRAVRLRAPVFISDLHLNDDLPATLARFLAFLEGDARRFGDLVVLGDLLEFWAGDDDLDTPGAIGARVAAALRAHAAAGHPVHLMHGNRDLLLGARFAGQAGGQLLADPTVATIDPGGGAAALQVLLSHGDAWCTADAPYQAFRAQVRDPRTQVQFLGRPLAERKAFIGAARAHSESRKRETAMDIMDVTPRAVDDALAEAGVTRVVHGHTHRPAVHALPGGGVRCVLPDWDFDAVAPAAPAAPTASSEASAAAPPAARPRGGYLHFAADGRPVLVQWSA